MLKRALCLALLLLTAASPVSAQGPQFTAASAAVIDHHLTVTFTETGLGNYQGQYIVYRAEAYALVTFNCVKRNGRISATRTYGGMDYGISTPDPKPADTVSYSIALAEMPSEPFTCSGGKVVLADARYSQVAIRDLSNGAVLNIPGDYQ